MLALNYRWLFKRVLDILFSALFMAVFLPFFLVFLLVDAIYNKVQNAYKSLFVSDYFAGKKGRVIRITVFATERTERGEDGKLLPERERVTPWGRFMKACGMKYYPCLPAVFTGKLSFVGPRPMTLTDAAALSEEGSVRFSVRPGLVSSLERYGGESLTWPDMFEEDAEYAAHLSLFKDVSFFMTKIANRLRGDTTQHLGVCAETGYVEWLAGTGEQRVRRGRFGKTALRHENRQRSPQFRTPRFRAAALTVFINALRDGRNKDVFQNKERIE